MVLLSFAHSVSSSVARGLNFSLGVVALLLYSPQRSDENPESLPKPTKEISNASESKRQQKNHLRLILLSFMELNLSCSIVSGTTHADDASDVSSAYETGSSTNGKLNDEHSLGLSEPVRGQNHSERLSPSACIGEGGGLIMFLISRNGV